MVETWAAWCPKPSVGKDCRTSALGCECRVNGPQHVSNALTGWYLVVMCVVLGHSEA